MGVPGVFRRLLAVVWVVVIGSLAVPVMAAAAPSARVDCAPLYLYGLRGSGETPGLGAPIGAIADAVTASRPGQVATRASAYPASPFDYNPLDPNKLTKYKASLTEGVRLFPQDLAWFADNCPGSDVAIVGYSQGADVVRRALHTGITPSSRYNVILLGDPNLNGDETTISMADEDHVPVDRSVRGFSQLFTELAPVPAFAPGWTASSVCRKGDPICRTVGNPDPNGPHTQYALGAADIARTILDWSDHN